MRLARLVLGAVLLSAAPVSAADPPAIRKSDQPAPVPPAPTPQPGFQLTLDVPAEITPHGGYARFTPKTNAVSIVYVGLDGIDPFPSEELRDARRFLLPVGGVAEGRYRFAAVAAGPDGVQARADFVVLVGNSPIPPPGPKPPGPLPQPADPLVAAFHAGYLLDADPDKAALVGKLAELFGSTVAAAKASGKILTLFQLQQSAHAAADIAVGKGKLLNTRKAVSAYLQSKLGTASKPMTDDLWTQVGGEFAAVSAALKGVK